MKSKDTIFPKLRDLNGLCAALTSFVALPASSIDPATAVTSTGPARTLKFPDGTIGAIRGDSVIAIAEFGSVAHVKENAVSPSFDAGRKRCKLWELRIRRPASSMIMRGINGQTTA